MIVTSDSQVLKTKEQMVLREEFDDWAILFDPDTGRAMGISPTGATIWKCLASDAKLDVQAIAGTLREEYDGIPDTVDTEILEFIDSVRKHGYVEERS
jgi:hypothetical protein